MDVMKTTNAARKVYGNDISILVALSVSRGDDSNLIIVSGKRQDSVAKDIAMFVGNKTTITITKHERFSCINDSLYMTTEITF